MKQQAATLIVAAFAFVTTQAWAKTIEAAFVEFTGIRPGSLLSSTIYASVLTIAAVFVTRYLMRHVQESPKERENGERDEKPLATNDR